MSESKAVASHLSAILFLHLEDFLLLFFLESLKLHCNSKIKTQIEEKVFKQCLPARGFPRPNLQHCYFLDFLNASLDMLLEFSEHVAQL